MKHFSNFFSKELTIANGKPDEWLFSKEDKCKITPNNSDWYLCYGLCEYLKNTNKRRIKFSSIKTVKTGFSIWFKQFDPKVL